MKCSAVLLVLDSALAALGGQMRAEEPGVLVASVQPIEEREELAGAVMLVAGRDKVLAVEAAGWADVASQKPMRPNAIFWIALYWNAHCQRTNCLGANATQRRLEFNPGDWDRSFSPRFC